ncbi:MAG: formyltransferase family protein [Desulfatiglandaceae bacterium]|jgi:folate-dependent phosphoribosylglycinamide formyltransferase PurN
MAISPIFDPKAKGRPMRVAAFMSGSGTNIRKLIQCQRELEREQGGTPFKVLFIFSDRSDGGSSGEEIALENGLPYFSYDIRRFHALRSINRSALAAEGLAVRREYDRLAGRLAAAFEIDVIALGGYMSYITLGGCVNVHPADLSILTPDGRRKYVGGHAVRDAIESGEQALRASTLWTDQGVDTGPLLMVSAPLLVTLPLPLEKLVADRDHFQHVVDEHQEGLKEAGDWRIFPRTIEMIARGRFGLDEDNRVYVDGVPVPEGYREEG